jgi:hypothetical protein
MEYHRTKDILYVKQLLGHKSLKNTLVYTHLVEFDNENQYVIKVASSLDEFTSLLENGFQYISDYNDKKIFRKRARARGKLIEMTTYSAGVRILSYVTGRS